MIQLTKLFVGNLPYTVNDQQLHDAFAAHGAVLSAAVINDRYSGRSKGFGFVEMENDEEAQTAMNALNGTDMGGRSVVVSVARPREERPNRPFGHGGGGNDRRGGGGGGFRGGNDRNRFGDR